MKLSKYSQNPTNKGHTLMKNKKLQGNSERTSKSPVKLPNLKSAYTKHPGEGLNIRGGAKGKAPFPKKLCGLCGSLHSPGEPHAAK